MALLLAGLVARPASAGPWSIEPHLGVSAEYASNPELQQIDVESEEHVAALADVPLRYDADDVSFMIRPSGRLSNSAGYSSLASNYAHLDSSAQLVNELGSTSLQGEWARDSSLYYVGALVNGVGVRRDTALMAGDWSRSITERTSVQLDASWTEVRYSQPPQVSGVLVDYHYLNAGPTFSVALTERNTLKLSGNYGKYQSLDGITESKSENLQLAFVRQLTEIWSLSTSGGYSRSLNSEKEFFGPFLLGTASSNQDGAVYAATVTRQGERFNVGAGVSRALQPTGFAYLSRQDTVNLNATYKLSDRWDFAAVASWQRALNPEVFGNGTIAVERDLKLRYLNALVTANWHWTTQWIVSLHATRVTTQYGPPTVSAGSTGVSVDLSRQFLRTQF